MSKDLKRAKLRREIGLLGGAMLLGPLVFWISVSVSKYWQHRKTGYTFISGRLVYMTTAPPDHSPETVARMQAYKLQVRRERRWAERHALRLHYTNRPSYSNVDLLSFSSDSKLLASSHPDGCVRLWNMQNAKLLHTFKGVRRAVLSPDGKTLACVWRGGAINLRDSRTGRVRRTFWWRDKPSLLQKQAATEFASRRTEILRHTELHALAFSPDGKTLAGGGFSGIVRLWNVRTGRLRRKLFQPLALEAYPSAFSPDGEMLAVAFYEYGSEARPAETFSWASQSLAMWRVPTGKMLWKSDDDIKAVLFVDQRRLLTVTNIKARSSKRGVRWRDARTGRLQRTHDPGEFGSETSVSPDGAVAASKE